MTAAPDPAPLQGQTQALLDLIEADRARRCALVLGEAEASAKALRAKAGVEARARMRQAFAEQRALHRERLAAAQARLATQRRAHAQQHRAALLQLAWAQLPGALIALWQSPPSRAAWVAQVLTDAKQHLPPGGWLIRHAPDWPEAGQPLTDDSCCEADPAIAAGLKVMAGGNVIDGTLAALLADRADFESRLLRRIEELS